jgi:integrase
MNRPRDRKSAKGLLPRMEARPWANGKTVTYRYHPAGGSPINLGTDKAVAIRKVALMNSKSDDAGTIGALWDHYQSSPDWASLTERSRRDYTDYSEHLLRVFADTLASNISAPMISRYLRVERKSAPVRANREISLLGNLISLAIDRGEAEHNPCRGGQVRRNKERPRTIAPETADIAALVAYASTRGRQWTTAKGKEADTTRQWRIITMAAEFAALVGSRQMEFLQLHWPMFGLDEVRLRRGKQRAGAEKVERITVSPALLELRERLQAIATNPTLGAVFPNRQGNPYTADGFASMWQKLIVEAVEKQVIGRRFTFHDLRAYYTTQHKETTGILPDLHASPTTTARVYERSKVAKRKAL